VNVIIKHKPNEGLLNRELSIANSKHIIDKYSPYLVELIDYSTNVLARCEQSLKGTKGTHLSPILLYYQAIQFADGIEALASQSCFTATKPLLRSLMETTFSIEYMIENDYELLSKAWLVQSYLERRGSLESLEPSTQKGKEFLEGLRRDKFIKPDKIYLPARDEVELAIDEIDKVLSKTKFKIIVSAFKGKGKIRKWYSFDGGPKTFKELALKLKRQTEYEFVYKDLSEIVHAVNSEGIIEKIADVKVFTRIRNMAKFENDIFIYAGAYLNECTIAMGSKFRAGENIRGDIKEIVMRHRSEEFQ